MLLLFSFRELNDHLFWKKLSFDLLCVPFVYIYESVCMLFSLLVLRVGCEI